LRYLSTRSYFIINKTTVFFFTVASSYGQDGHIYFSVSPAAHSVVEGLSVRLRCEAQPSLHVKYSWKREGKPLAPNPRSHQIDGDLNITRAHRMDSGNYVCVATHEKSNQSIESSPAKIDVQCKFCYFTLILARLLLILKIFLWHYNILHNM
jgi:hypothetical protein